VRKAIFASIVALAFLAGCENRKAPEHKKWEGPPYRLTLGAASTKPSPAGALTLPPIYFTANPDGVLTRANMVMRIDGAIVKKKPVKFTDQLLLAPTDIAGKEGALSDSYLSVASTELAKMLNAYSLNGKVKVHVALVKSSIMMSATDAQVDSHRLSEWLPIEVDFVNPHPNG